jgi:hypothetical protein
VNMKEIGKKSAEWIHVAQGSGQWLAVVSTVIYLRVSPRSGSFVNASETVSLAKSTYLAACS